MSSAPESSRITFHPLNPEVSRGSSVSESEWERRRVCCLGPWVHDHPYLSIGLIVLVGVVAFAILAGLALGGIVGGGIPLVIGMAVGAGVWCALGGGALFWAKGKVAENKNSVRPQGPVVEEGENQFANLTLEDFQGGRSLTQEEVEKILARNPVGVGKAKNVYPVNDHIVLMQPKPFQEAKLAAEVQLVQDIHKKATEAAPGERLFLATGYLSTGYPNLYLARRYVGDLTFLLNGPFEDPSAGIPFDFNLEFALQLIDGLFQGLLQLHNAGFVHGDVKPENILVFFDEHEHRWVAVFNDFGETRYANEGEKVLHGDWRYSSPEQRSHQPSDVYALGLVAMRLLERAYDIGSNHPQSIERCFPVQDRGLYAFMKTGIARLGGIFGSIVFRPQATVHEHIQRFFDNLPPENQNENMAALCELLQSMTRDIPDDRWGVEPPRISMEEAVQRYRNATPEV